MCVHMSCTWSDMLLPFQTRQRSDQISFFVSYLTSISFIEAFPRDSNEPIPDKKNKGSLQMRDRKQLGKLFWRTLIQNFVLMKGEWIDHVTKLWIMDLPKEQSYGVPKQLYKRGVAIAQR